MPRHRVCSKHSVFVAQPSYTVAATAYWVNVWLYLDVLTAYWSPTLLSEHQTSVQSCAKQVVASLFIY